ncbi:SDR family oxidoreductase [Gracilibacillus alcaliphilus]|uniref:SDR family oxidoreductase n=1 Tax=Gracilibacillus alcaliphilus TaxID=1401441 RepID=UPI0019593823|nr:SDR family oxidoreductase [Gracilibacillus alcaliphilus]MBM7676712.1 3-oxoacyl-[acyl-carrier protein] reductase [Gracilibacillus alcaliphilus]
MDLHLKGKSVIVTAASKGLGKAIAKKFAEEGAYVLISSRSEQDLQKTQQEIRKETGNDHIEYIVCDMKDVNAIQQMVVRAAQLYGGIDILINNAGGPPPGNFDQVSDNDWQHAFELNLLSFVRTIREVLPYMRKQKQGHIVNLTSSSIKQPIDDLILSNVYRTGLTGLAKSLSQELAADNILINTVGPGRIETGRVQELDRVKAENSGMSYEEVKHTAEESIPLKRYGAPEEFANVVVFLCSDANSYITGQALLVDGGMVKAL